MKIKLPQLSQILTSILYWLPVGLLAAYSIFLQIKISFVSSTLKSEISLMQQRMENLEKSLQVLSSREIIMPVPSAPPATIPNSLSSLSPEELAQLTEKINENREQLKTLEGKLHSDSNLGEPQKIAEINASKRKQYLMKIKLNRYYNENGKYPQNLNELRTLLGTIPEEDVSKSSRLVLDKDLKGGWFYSVKKGAIEPNVQ